MCIIQRLRVTWSIGQKYSARPVAHDFIGCRGRWHDLHAKSPLTETAKNVVLHTKIKSHDWNICRRELVRIVHVSIRRPLDLPVSAQRIFWVPGKTFTVSHFLDVIPPDDSLPISSALHCLLVTDVLSGEA